MAVVSATSNGVEETAAETTAAKKGWLSKRTQFTYRWKPAWFVLKETQLLYGDNEKEDHKKINLVGASIKPVEDSGSQFSWTVTPKESKRIYFLRASSAEEQEEWMQAICTALMSSSSGHASHTCIIQ
ncbi:PH domain-containing protein DDB_G0274775 [Amia ocellicauda]|uniref:PH domain-containing protein DDB_G0274775 n=1 Tax=Amia ocellicauda TaxID=2972642 RepID=UPI00346466E0